MSSVAATPAAVNLRPYQTASVEEVRARIRAGHKRILLVIPTGGGKTLTAASMLISAVAKGSPVLFVAHRKELIDQTAKSFGRLGVTQYGIIRANDPRRDPTAPIQIASLPTLVNRTKPPAKVVFIDESHRALAKSYQKHIFEVYTDSVIVGLTATPCRTDGKPLGMSFTQMVIGATYSQLIEQGHIEAPIVYGTPILPDLSGVKTTAGDYNLEQLEDAVNRSALIGNVVDEWTKRAGSRRTVVFAVSVAHSKAICEAFTDAGVRIGHIDGTTPENEREATLAKLESGELQIVSNVGVLTEGWDMPSCKCLVLARPTKSLALYMQMAGRILRPWGDDTPLILDHGGNVDRHGMPHEDREWSLEAKVKRSKQVSVKPCPQCFAYVPNFAQTCPHCDHPFVDLSGGGDPEPKEDIVPVELALRTIGGDDERFRQFRALAHKAADRGWKPGAIWVRFKERFGEPPPEAWMKEIKRAHKADPEWKRKLDERKARGELEPKVDAGREFSRWKTG